MVTERGSDWQQTIGVRPKTEAEVRVEFAEAKAEHDRASAKLACVTAQAKRLGVPL